MNAQKTLLVPLLRVVSVMILLATLHLTPVTHATAPLATPASPPDQLVIGLGSEPNSLYIYGSSMLVAAHVRSAIYDGPIDAVSYTYQPVILERLPSLANGDLQIRVVNVGVGSRVVDTYDNVVDLTGAITVPVRLRPAGCHSNACAIPWLPATGTIAMEQMVARFTLISGVTWADGTPVTAADSVYSFELATHPDTPNLNRYTGKRTASYTAEGDRTVVWTGLPGYGDSTYFTNFWTPLPEHLWGSLSPAELVTATISSRTPMGYGPYTVQAWTPGEAITLTANSHYFRAAEGLPRIPTLVFRFVGSGQDALDALAAGQVDMLTRDTGLDSAIPQLLGLVGQGLVHANFGTTTAFEHADFGITPAESYVRPDFFADARMRQAISMCLDRQAVVDDLLYGMTIIPGTYVPPEHPLYPAGLTLWPYNPISATLMLEQMGWVDQDHDGIRECHGCDVAGAVEGTPLAFSWKSTAAPLRVAYMQMFRDDLAACGIALTLENLSAYELFANGPEGPLFGRKFDIASFAWLTGVEPPCQLYMSSQIPGEENGWAGRNNIGYSNPAFDAACSAARQSLPGTPAYVAGHQAAMRIQAEELPTLPLFLRLWINAGQPRLVGFYVDPTATSELYNVEEWYFLEDGSPPSGTLRAGDGSQAVNDVNLTLHLTADDAGGGSVQQMLLREQVWDGLAWNMIAQSGWASSTASYTWTLAATSGAHYLSAYWMDDSGNVSPLPAQALVNYTPASADIAGRAVHVYRMRMQAGASFTATLTTHRGDADLYVWRPGNDGAPDAYSNADGTATDQVVITDAEEGDYQVEVHGYAEQSTYHLELTAPSLAQRSVALRRVPTSKPVPSAPVTTAVPDDTPVAAPGGLPASVTLRSPLERLPTGGRQAPFSVLVYDARRKPVADGTVVTFTTTRGHFAESGAAIATQETVDGIARVTLVSGDDVGQAEVTATAGEAQGMLSITVYVVYPTYLPLVLRRSP